MLNWTLQKERERQARIMNKFGNLIFEMCNFRFLNNDEWAILVKSVRHRHCTNRKSLCIIVVRLPLINEAQSEPSELHVWWIITYFAITERKIIRREFRKFLWRSKGPRNSSFAFFRNICRAAGLLKLATFADSYFLSFYSLKRKPLSNQRLPF